MSLEAGVKDGHDVRAKVNPFVRAEPTSRIQKQFEAPTSDVIFLLVFYLIVIVFCLHAILQTKAVTYFWGIICFSCVDAKSYHLYNMRPVCSQTQPKAFCCLSASCAVWPWCKLAGSSFSGMAGMSIQRVIHQCIIFLTVDWLTPFGLEKVLELFPGWWQLE